MRYLGLICARGGSKGIPGKNIKMLAGKPLIAWAIEAAKAVKRLERVVVSTDSPEIAQIALDFGAEVPFMRPPELARDDSPEWQVWRYMLSLIPAEVLVSIPVTSPLRDPIDIEHCLDEYERNNCDAVITVSKARRNPYFNMVKYRADGHVGLFCHPSGGWGPSDKPIARRQDAPEVYDMTTVAYIVRSKLIFEKEDLFSGRVTAVCIPEERAIDIDTPLDFKIAEYLKRESI